MLNDFGADFPEGSKRAEGDPDQDVLGVGAVGEGVLDFLGVGQGDLLDVGQVLGLALLVGNQALGNNLLQLGVLLALCASDAASLTFFLTIFDRLNISECLSIFINN